MKFSIFIFQFAIGLLLCGGASAQLRTTLTLEHDYPTNELTNVTFYYYGAPDLREPIDTWQVMAVNRGTSNAPTPCTITIPIEPQAYFFAAKASNLWGLSPFSNVAAAPSPPRSDITLRLK